MATVNSLAWGGGERQINQGFEMGLTPQLQSWYGYSDQYCLPAGFHAGLDIDMPRMTPVYALSNGTVIQAGMSDYFRPKPVHIKTDDGFEEIYGHLWEDTVAVGDRVKPGQQVGFSGEQTYAGTMTPDGSGPHLHFELRQPNASCGSGYAAIDPTSYLEGHGAAPSGVIPSTGGTSSTGGGSLNLTKTIGEYGQRSLLVGIGGLSLVIGLYGVFSGKVPVKSIKKIATKGIL